MGKNRPYIPPPIVTPPSVVVPRATESAPVAEPAPAPPLAIVPPSPRVARVELLADRIVLTNPTIRLDIHIFIPGTGGKVQTNELKPDRAEIMHGEIIIDELGVIWPVGRAYITTR